MLRTLSCYVVVSSAALVACGGSSSGEGPLGSSGSGSASTGGTAPTGTEGTGSSGTGSTAGSTSVGGSAGDGNASTGVLSSHLGKPFPIIDGVIQPNDYGLQASFYVVRDEQEPELNVTRSTGEICVQGELTRALLGDVDNYWGFTFGFTTAPPAQRTLTETLLSTSPDAPAWDYASAGVLGISFEVSGSVLPNSESFGLGATPGGQDSGGLFGVEQALTIFGDCAAPPITSSGQRVTSLFSELENFWCLPEYKSKWSADSVVTFWWGVGSVLVEQIDPDAGINTGTDPYDFCVGNIRPVLLGAGPDEPGEPLDTGADPL